MKDTDIAYIAGLFDGEGSISASYGVVSKVNVRVTVQIAMCDREPLDLVASVFGGCVKELKRKTKTGKSVYQWVLNCRKAADFLEVISPYLRIKGERARWAISVARMTRLTGKKLPFTDDEVRCRRELVSAIKAANCRSNGRIARFADAA